MSNWKRILVTAASATTALAVLAGCGTNSATSTSQSTTSTTGASSGNVITVGTLYASTGAFATSSMPEYQGLQFWAHEVNAKGGVLVKATGKKEKIQLVSYNDQSSASTAINLYNQLITQNHVNVLVSDFGSVLTSVAVPIAQENKMVLFDQTGTGASFFTPNNPYIVLTSLPTSQIWPNSLANYIIQSGIKKVGILYCENDFDQSQEATLVQKLQAAGITPVYNTGVPTSTSNYSVLVHNLAATNPQMVVELGYPNNDIAFLQAVQSTGVKFNKTFMIFPGQLPTMFEKDFSKQQLSGLYTYPTPPYINYTNVNYGLPLPQFEQKFEQFSGKNHINFLNVAGYTTGLVIQKALETSPSLSQSALRQAVSSFSGQMNTLDGTFQINSEGAQTGETLPVGQFTLNSSGNLAMNILK
ncbi:ABC transporter substrate-binding protein [Sulfoacidibacillus thermotolerans]|uniref:Amino acid ABC transporter substrate-binding protein n=1 Tax=Sulfoacidibacillus thermotolerans TaxID=1765684 RepID=A0A2U3D951_SULT2|nr:ABC transporter substrate-binding protein [Sulfoacidibacillus thermotolerans]PWI57806.1 amino acid ABC transporter substrate-binding protein [Sulfoacidibacillus thermotolerans]